MGSDTTGREKTSPVWASDALIPAPVGSCGQPCSIGFLKNSNSVVAGVSSCACPCPLRFREYDGLPAIRSPSMSDTLIPVPPEWKKRAYIDAENYEGWYLDSVARPDAFWGEEGRKLQWIKPFTKVKDTSY